MGPNYLPGKKDQLHFYLYILTDFHLENLFFCKKNFVINWNYQKKLEN